MKTLKICLKPISYLLTFLILLQGCTVYKKQNISLEQAVETKNKVKILTKENEKQKYDYVTTNNGEYYGTKKVNKELIKTPIQKENIKVIKTKNIASSIYVSILASAGGLLVLGSIIAGITGNFAAY